MLFSSSSRCVGEGHWLSHTRVVCELATKSILRVVSSSDLDIVFLTCEGSRTTIHLFERVLCRTSNVEEWNEWVCSYSKNVSGSFRNFSSNHLFGFTLNTLFEAFYELRSEIRPTPTTFQSAQTSLHSTFQHLL